VRELRAIFEEAPRIDTAMERLSGALTRLAKAPRAAPAPAPSQATAAAPPGRDWFTPHLEMSAEADLVLRHAVLLEVQRALVTHARMQQGAGHDQLKQGDLVLSGVLPVMQLLAERLTGLANTYVGADQRGAFLDALRRSVATAIRDLSTETGQAIDAPEVGLPPAEG
jgi:hypothetical protein